MDLRKRAVAAVLRDGLSRHESAARFRVAPSAVINWVRRVQETGGDEGHGLPMAVRNFRHQTFAFRGPAARRLHVVRPIAFAGDHGFLKLSFSA
jgi:transposase-like protein